MKRLVLLTVATLLAWIPAVAQNVVEIFRDSGSPRGSHNRPGWEESVILQPKGPARVVGLRIYYTGTVARTDTIHIVGDPSEGAIPPTSFVWSYNHLTDPIAVEYNGTPGWFEVDLAGRNVRSDGFDRIVVQHRISSGGPFFSHDGSTGTPYSSFLFDPVTLNDYGFPGKYYLASGDMLVRLKVVYDFPMNDTSAPPPAPTLVDVTQAVGLIDGSGNPIKSSRVSVADWNGDGYDDVAIGSKFFRNKGDGTFEDVSASMGIAASASAWADYDNDGDLDCYAVNGGAGDALYRNDGVTFTSVKAEAGIDNPRPTVTPIWLDFDRDGWLDLFIANGRTESGGQEVYFPDVMFRNNGDGTFDDVTTEVGFLYAEPAPYTDCWGASATDFNQDGLVDIHVATYRLAPDLLYANQGNDTYSDVAFETGVQGVPTADARYFGHGIGTEWGDFNNDALPDLAVGNLGHPDWRGQVSNPSLIFQGSGSASAPFAERHHEMGLKFFEMNAGVVWLDLDLDGNLDLWHCQYAYNAAGSSGEPRRLSRVYLNGGQEASFRLSDVTWQLGSLIHGAWTAARGDFDRDGRMDILVASPHEGVRLYHNEVQTNGKFLSLRLQGAPGSRVPADGVGSRVKVYAGGRMFYRELMGAGGGTTSTQNSSELHFGLGDVSAVDSVVIYWPNGTVQTMEGSRLEANRHHRVVAAALSAEEEISAAHSWRLESAEYADGTFRATIGGTLKGGRMEVIDLLGRVLGDRPFPDGTRSVELPAAASAGLYVVRIVAGGEEAVSKVAVAE